MKEVEISPKTLTGLKSLLKAKDFGKSSRIAKEVLQMVVLELHCRPNFLAATSSPSLISTMEHENELKRATRGQLEQQRYSTIAAGKPTRHQIPDSCHRLGEASKEGGDDGVPQGTSLQDLEAGLRAYLVGGLRPNSFPSLALTTRAP
jgi:hypothetical protein